MKKIFLATLLLLFSLVTLQAQTSIPIHYTLPQSGKVSLAVYDKTGKYVRTLLAAQQQASGAQQLSWNGLDDKGNPVAGADSCTYKVLLTQGLQADYLMTLASSLPKGDEHWKVGLGNHEGPRSIAVDGSGVYIGAGNSENVQNAVKISLDGAQSLWSAWQPQAFMGRFSLAVMDGNLFHLQQNARVAGHGVNSPNKRHQSVGDPNSSWTTGFGWDALYAGAIRSGANDWSNVDGSGGGRQFMDMAAYNTGSNPQLVLSYKNNNAIQWRTPTTGAILEERAITAPLGVAIDNSGSVLVISGSSVLKVNRGSAPVTLISGLTSPYRLDVDRSNGNILVAQQGSSQQVKRFSSTGSLLNTYGAFGGRSYGIYNGANFKDIADITSDNGGGFYVVESSAPRRVVHVGSNGSVIKEWYGGTHWVPSASIEPDNPGVVWVSVNGYELMRLTLNYSTKTWQIHSVYKYTGLGGGLIGASFSGGAQGIGGGYGDWHVRKHNGNTYLVRRGYLQVLKVDQTNWSLKAVVVADFSHNDASHSYIWTDANGDGLPQETEYRRYNWGLYGYNHYSLVAPVGFSYFRLTKDATIFKHDITGWNSIGAPIYRDLNINQAFGGGLNYDGNNNYYNNPPNAFARETESSPLYVSINASPTTSIPWGQAPYSKMFKLDASGNFEWKVGEHIDRPSEPAHPAPGKIYNFKNNVGVVHGVVVATDFDGGWDGKHTGITYAYDQDGLYVGGLFTEPNTTSQPEWQYNHSTDNGTGSMYKDPATGDVIYAAGIENEVRIFKVTGWNNFVRLSGKVGSQPVVASNFYRAINLNGAASSIDNNSWEASGTASNFSYSNHYGVFSNQNVTLVPSTDANRASMIRSSIWGATPSLTLSAVPTGEYDVYLYVWEDNGAAIFDVFVEGTLVENDYNSGPAGTWRKLGPYRANVTDGTITLSTSGGNANLSGLEVWKAGEQTGTFSGYYKLTAKHSGKALDVSKNSTADGALIQQWNYAGNENQIWEISSTGNGYYKLTAKHSGKVLDVSGGMNALGDGAGIIQWPYYGTDNQKWKIESTGDGYYKLLVKHSGKALDVTGGPSATADGALLQQWSYVGNDNQKWLIERVNTTAKLGAEHLLPNSAKVTVYPNPAQTEIHIFQNDNSSWEGLKDIGEDVVEVDIYDIRGNLVKKNKAVATKESELVISVKHLPVGMYLVKIRKKASVETQKIIINR